MFLRKNKELTAPSIFKRIVSLIETAQTSDELIEEYFRPEVMKEIQLMKSRDKTEIESRYLKRKDFLNRKRIGNEN